MTYYDGVQPLTKAFDGFFVHSRGSGGLPLVGPGKSADIASAIGGTPAIFRTDQPAPVLDLQSESDLIGLLDSYWRGSRTTPGSGCGGPRHRGTSTPICWSDSECHPLRPPHQRRAHQPGRQGRAPGADDVDRVRRRARLRAPHRGAGGGLAQIRRDPLGIALGGIRTRPSTCPPPCCRRRPGRRSRSSACSSGRRSRCPPPSSTSSIPRGAYLAKYDADADAAIKAGFVLQQDRAALLAFADPSVIPA